MNVRHEAIVTRLRRLFPDIRQSAIDPYREIVSLPPNGVTVTWEATAWLTDDQLREIGRGR